VDTALPCHYGMKVGATSGLDWVYMGCCPYGRAGSLEVALVGFLLYYITTVRYTVS
jgi:hypothetical protein